MIMQPKNINTNSNVNTNPNTNPNSFHFAQHFYMRTFRIADIEDIVIQELKPNGYVKTVYSIKYGSIVYYYNKDKQLISHDISNVINNPTLDTLDSVERFELFDKLFIIWYQYKIQDLKDQNVDLINKKENLLKILQQQADELLKLKTTLSRDIK